jgi:hypothetical protein
MTGDGQNDCVVQLNHCYILAQNHIIQYVGTQMSLRLKSMACTLIGMQG